MCRQAPGQSLLGVSRIYSNIVPHSSVPYTIAAGEKPMPLLRTSSGKPHDHRWHLEKKAAMISLASGLHSSQDTSNIVADRGNGRRDDRDAERVGVAAHEQHLRGGV